jgi:hypothetical protein
MQLQLFKLVILNNYMDPTKRKTAALGARTNPAPSTVMDNIEPFADQHPAQRRAYVTEDEVDRLIAAAKTSSKRGASGEMPR